MTAEAEAPTEKAHPYEGGHLTRADLERLIVEHGGPEGVDLTGAIAHLPNPEPSYSGSLCADRRSYGTEVGARDLPEGSGYDRV